MDSGLVAVVCCVLIGAVLIVPMILTRKRAPEESGRSPDYESFCSGSMGGIARANIPVFRLSIYKEFLVVCCIKPKVIPFAEIVHAEVRGQSFDSRLFFELKSGATYLLSVRNPRKVLEFLPTPD